MDVDFDERRNGFYFFCSIEDAKKPEIDRIHDLYKFRRQIDTIDS
jgi:hypothetical protein